VNNKRIDGLKKILEILLTLDPGMPQVFQWPLNIET
jgi:hypothetical protein